MVEYFKMVWTCDENERMILYREYMRVGLRERVAQGDH